MMCDVRESVEDELGCGPQDVLSFRRSYWYELSLHLHPEHTSIAFGTDIPPNRRVSSVPVNKASVWIPIIHSLNETNFLSLRPESSKL